MTARELHFELRAQAMARVDLALKVAIFQRAGVPRAEIAERLGVSANDVRHAVEDLREIAPYIEIGERPGDDTGALTL